MIRGDITTPAERMDHFAELLSIELDRQSICERMGLGRNAYYAMLFKLRKRLGPQAI
jgi:hypothetical protein